jgi:transcriptional regulator with XRE-family HTH domain
MIRVSLWERCVAEPTIAPFGDLLRKVRADAGFTQEELATRAGISARSVSDLERGVNLTARRDTARLLADALGLAGKAKAEFEAAARGRALHLVDREWQPETAISITPPVGQLDPGRPMRGRDRFLAALTGPDSGVLVVHGMGGCGKTRLALEAAAAALSQGTEVWWISAAERSGLEAGMRALGRRLGLADTDLGHGDAADLIWRRIAAHETPWLLVVDNADDPRVLAGAGNYVAEGRGWLRPVATPGPGMVLVTSRDGSQASWGPWCARYRLAMLAARDATAVLADYAGHRPQTGSDEDGRQLAVRLGCLPLALKIAGSYLAESAGRPAAFAGDLAIRTYRQYQDALDAGQLGAVFPPGDGELTADQARATISRTWNLTLDLLESRRIPEARWMLRLLATFADAPVPYQLLRPETLSAWQR